MLYHPLAVHFPLALFLTSTFFDLLAWRWPDPFYLRAASWLVGLGLLGALLSIALGWVDLLAMERLGIGPGLLIRHRVHSGMAYAATAVYGVTLAWRWRSPQRVAGARLVLSVIGAVLIAITGYLGGELRNVM
jgi:uncharacterized membrane protein